MIRGEVSAAHWPERRRLLSRCPTKRFRAGTTSIVISGTIIPVRTNVLTASGHCPIAPSMSNSRTVIVGHAAAHVISRSRMLRFQRRSVVLQMRDGCRARNREDVG